MLRGKRIFITGANGFIGKNIIRNLLTADNEIAIVTRDTINNDFLNNDKVKSYVGNIEDAQFIEHAIQTFKPQIVYHLAANKNSRETSNNLSASIKTNLTGTLNIYEQLVKVKELESVVALGTIDEYGKIAVPYNELQTEHPCTSYGLSKLLATQLADYFFQVNKLPIKVLRPSIAYGPWQGNEMFIPSLINTLLQNKVYEMTRGEQERDFIYIDDLVDVMINIAKLDTCNGKIFNVGYGESFKIKDIAIMVANKLEKLDLLKIGTIDYRNGESMYYSVSNELLKKQLNWHPKVHLNEGLELTIQHFKDKF